MKTIKNFYKQLTYDRVKEIIILASKGKRYRREVKRVLLNIDEYTYAIMEMLKNKDYFMLPSHHRTIIEKGKERDLTISPFFPNRILDYIVVELVKPYIRKSMYEYCIGNVDNRGMVYGKKVIARKYKHYKYYLKLDIHHFYPSVKSTDLIKMIEKRVYDKDYIDLAKCVCLSVNDLPIGSYYSQWFSNWFLQDLDHLIKEEWKTPFYVRYVDDMLLMGNSKKQLLRTMYNIQKWLKTYGLELKRIEQVYQVENRPIDFLGFRFCTNKVILRTRNFHRLNIRIKKIRKNKHISVSQARGILSYIGWLKQTKLGYLYYQHYIKTIFKLGTLKRIISTYDKKKRLYPIWTRNSYGCYLDYNGYAMEFV